MTYYTYPGQAHNADPSIYLPCRFCAHLKPRPFLLVLERHYCEKAKYLHGKWQSPIPPHAMSCKYFLWGR